MKTPIQEIIRLENELSKCWQDDDLIAWALLRFIRANSARLLNKEKQFIIKAHMGVTIGNGLLPLEKRELAKEYYDNLYNSKSK